LLEARAADHWIDADVRLDGPSSEIEVFALTTLRLHHVWML